MNSRNPGPRRVWRGLRPAFLGLRVLRRLWAIWRILDVKKGRNHFRPPQDAPKAARCLLLRQDRCLLLRQDRCLLLRQDRCLLLRQDRFKISKAPPRAADP